MEDEANTFHTCTSESKCDVEIFGRYSQGNPDNNPRAPKVLWAHWGDSVNAFNTVGGDIYVQ